MVIVLHDQADIDAVTAALQGLGLWTRRLHGNGGPVVLTVEAHSTQVATDRVLAVPGVAQVHAPKSPHPLVDRQPRRFTLQLRHGGALVLGADAAVLAAGPCAVESEGQIRLAAAEVARSGARLLRGGAWKPRTSPYAFAGEGSDALRWLDEAAAAERLGIVTEVLSEQHAAAVAAVADVIQIGARNMQNFALLAVVGRLAKPVLLKRARGASVEEWLLAGEHLLSHGAAHVVFCERGGQASGPELRGQLDVGAVALLRHVHGLVVAVDPSHAAGRRDLVAPLARAGVAAGASLVLVEMHPQPQDARSDGPQALLPAELHGLARDLHVSPSPGEGPYTSRHPDFYKLSVERRRAVIAGSAALSEAARQHLTSGDLPLAVADRMTENVVSTFALPLSIGLNVRVNGRDHLVPMVVEEPSVVAAVSNAARMVRASGGFRGDATASVMTAQVQLDRVAQPVAAAAQLSARRDEIVATANAAIPRMVERGGGCVDVDVRVLDPEEGLLVIHLYVDVGDAMGANLVDTVAERVAPVVQGWVGGTVGLRILSNLPLRRVVHVECDVAADAVGGVELADGIARASRFAEMDPFRAVTHNKGVMNGIDAVALALGQDWRAIEAGAHSYAAIGSQYRPVAVWHRTDSGLRGEIELPLAIGTVGGSTQAHPGVRAAMEIVRVDGARQLAVVMAAVGLASNLAALRALAGEGIQQGHMRLHARKHDTASGR
jgi:hydroxymethylglutaryl-CoA reductase